jgi:hypothetical protein
MISSFLLALVYMMAMNFHKSYSNNQSKQASHNWNMDTWKARNRLLDQTVPVGIPFSMEALLSGRS